ncbi:MAG: hypothetical protein PHX52_02905 [Candidatus Pacebacteria bacterium]|nr:hypothetical protein [Candidatus Paceibacterota bacterium]MDD3919509.1 hypothetical protein [Candidatus Paceibacterota bacterium]
MHNCSTIIIHCIDFRLINKIREWMDQNGFKNDTDVLSLGGGIKELVDGTKEIQEFILKQIGISYNLHNARKVVLMQHSDCGAYKTNYNFIDGEAEFAQQLEDMHTAEEMIKNYYDDIVVEKIWIQMKDPHGEEVEFTNL